MKTKDTRVEFSLSQYLRAGLWKICDTMIKQHLPTALRRLKIIASLTFLRNVKVFSNNIYNVYMYQIMLLIYKITV